MYTPDRPAHAHRRNPALPRIGLLSDSHGHVGVTHRGAQILADDGAQLLLHLGDIGTTDVIDALLVASPDTGKPVPCRIVFGNTDWEPAELHRHADRHGITVDHPAGTIALGDRNLVFTHGHRPQIFNQALADGVAYFCHGHTHQQSDARHRKTRIINPGALHRASRYTVALLDTDADQVVFHEVDR